MRACLAGLLCVAGPALAADPQQMSAPTREDTMLGIVGPTVRTGVELRVGATHSDNVRRTLIDKQDDTIATVGAAVDVQHDGTRLDYAASGDIERVEFLDNSYDGRVLGSMNANATLDFIPKRFYWIATDTFGQVASDPFAQVTPANLENINYFTTGPVAEFGIGGQNRLQLAGTYSLTTYEDLPLDNDRYGGSVALIRQLSDRNSVSLNVTAEQIKFDDLTDADYDRNSAYVHYEAHGGRTGVSLDAGYTEIDRASSQNVGSRNNSGLLARVSIDRRLSPSMAVSVFGKNQISDSADVFRGDNTRTVPEVQSTTAIATADSLEEKGYGAAWAFNRSRTGLGITFSSDKETYEKTPILDRKVTSIQLTFSRRMGPITTLGFDVRHDDEKFETTGQNDKELQISAQLRWALGRRAGLGLQVDRFERDSTNNPTAYDENRFGLNFYWRAVAGEER